MQRRLTVAFLALALAAVVLVGAGVLALSQVGARGEAEAETTERLEAVADLVEGPASLGALRPLAGRGEAFGLSELGFVVVSDQGDVQNLRLSTEGRRSQRATIDPAVLFRIEVDDQDRLAANQTVMLDRSITGARSVVGLRRLSLPEGAAGGATVAVMAGQAVAPISQTAVTWFMVSTLVVLVGGGVGASVLARLMTRPIAEIEQATASIAAGNLHARVEPQGADEVADLARSVNTMAAELQRSKALDQQFLLSVSHDLRTPLTAIGGYAEALVDGTAENPARTGDVIRTHADRLERLVGDLLDLAKLDANRFAFDLTHLDVAVTTGRVVAGLEPRASGFGLALDFVHQSGRPVEVVADAHRLGQVVGNLVDNALTFAHQRVVVRVSRQVGASGHNGAGWAVIEVIDDGPGIAPEDLPHVFDRLYVSKHQPERAESPTGMGLAIAQELTTAMGGSVQAGPSPGGGTIMVIRLPLAAPTGSPAATLG